MGRRTRIEFPGATYHVYARGNRQAGVFDSKGEYASYLEDLERIAGQHGTAVLAFCLMPNHTHLCLRTDGDALSVVMQRLNLRHARRFNLLRDVRGRLNESRYCAQLVDSERYLLCLVRYVHQNPVRAGLAPTADDWPFSSHQAYRGRSYRFVSTQEILARVGGAEGYASYLGVRPDDDELRLFEPDEKGRRLKVIGDERAPSALAQRLGPWNTPAPERPVEAAADGWAQEHGLRLDELKTARGARSRQLRRELAIELRARGYRLHQIGQMLGREVSTVSRTLLMARGCSESAASYGPC
jgi:putative transposase